MKIIAIITAKFILIIGKIFKRGSSLPGKIALKIDKNLLYKLKYPNNKIIVTGSSGKGSTTKLIAQTLTKANYKVCFNKSGSNLAWGITTALIECTNIWGKVESDYLVLESDERYVKKVFEALRPTHLVITNLTKDQPPRQHHIDEIFEDITQKLTKDTIIVTNIDDPYLQKLALDFKNKNIYFSLAKNKYSYEQQIFENLNTYYCPKCHTRLKYDYYNFESLGKYNCPKCDFKYIEPSVKGENLDLEKGTISINDKEVLIGGNLLYHAYNTLCAYTLLKSLNIKEDIIIDSFNNLNNVSSISFTNKNKIFYPYSCKAENATTYNQAIFKTIQDKSKKSIILGWKEISRRYNHFDISWLYDIEFELLNNDNVLYFYCCGPDKDNLKKRLLLSGIKEEKIITADNIPSIKQKVLKDKAQAIYGILNFDYIIPFKETFKEVPHD